MKRKRWWKLFATSLGVTGLIASVSVSAICCGSPEQNNRGSIGVNAGSMIGSNNGVNAVTATTPTSVTISTPEFFQNVLGTTTGQNALVTEYAQYAVYQWFKNSNNAVVQSIYAQQLAAAQKAYQTQYKNYSSAGGNWQNKFQQNVLDPNGGSEQAWIYKTLATNLMTQFSNLVIPSNFVNSYLSLQTASGTSNIAGSGLSLATINNPENVNGGFTVTPPSSGSSDLPTINWGDNTGIQTNNFVFAAANGANSGLANGYANFINFAFNQWVYQTMPILTPAILYKNGTSPSAAGLFNSEFFNSMNSGYEFQYFPKASGNAQVNTATNLYQEFINNLGKNYNSNPYVNANAGGAVNFPLSLTEGHTTTFETNVASAWTTYVTPFTAAIMYKFNNMLFGNGDGNGAALSSTVPTETTIQDNSSNAQSLMQNFLQTNNGTSGGLGFASAPQELNESNGVFDFPYVNAKNSTQPFKGAYSNAYGIRDTVNIPNSPFIMTRDQFGIHVIAIDRWLAMRAALDKLPTNATNQQKIQAVDTVLRNTILWRAAQAVAGASNGVKLEDSLQTFITANLDRLILQYLISYIDPTASTAFMPATSAINAANNVKNNLFSAQWAANSDVSWQKLFTTSFGSGTNKNNLCQLFNAIWNLQTVQSDQKYIDTVKKDMYKNQSSYNSTTSAKSWTSYGIAGILPYARNAYSGGYDSLEAVILNSLPGTLQNAMPASQTAIENSGWIPAQYLKLLKNGTTVAELPIVELDYDLGNTMASFTEILGNYISAMSAAGENSNYWSEGYFSPLDPSQTFTDGSAQTVFGQHNILFMNNLMVNLAVQSAQTQNSVINNISQNLLVQEQLNGLYNFQTNSFLPQAEENTLNGETFNAKDVTSLNDLNEWIKYWVQNAINSQYNITQFTGQSNLYANGNWNSYASVEAIANKLANGQIDANQTNVGSGVQQLNYAQNNSYYKFLETLAWLLDWNPKGGYFSFGNLITQLNRLVDNDQIGYLAWNFQNTNQLNVYANPTSNGKTPSSQPFGLTGTLDNYASAVQTAIQYDGLFKANPLYLTNLTPYSFWGANRLCQEYGSGSAYYEASSISNLSSDAALPINSTFTTLSNYWNVAPIGNDDATGFLGFQSAGLADSSLPSNFYSGSVFSDNFQNKSENYIGALYQYGSEQNFENLINDTTSSSALTTYLQAIQNCNFNLSVAASNDLSNALSGFQNNEPLTFAQKKNLAIEVVNSLNSLDLTSGSDPVTAADNAFKPLSNTFMWQLNGSTSTTLFANTNTSQNALKTEYVVNEFNSTDVKNLLANNFGVSTINFNNPAGFLRESNPQTFFDAVVLFAMNSVIQTNAADSITTSQENNQFTVYDNRIAQALGESLVKNWSDFDGDSN